MLRFLVCRASGGTADFSQITGRARRALHDRVATVPRDTKAPSMTHPQLPHDFRASVACRRRILTSGLRSSPRSVHALAEVLDFHKITTEEKRRGVGPSVPRLSAARYYLA